jgi:DNA helicase-2/ATP-dependent DNA helicase PcrA
VLELRSDLEDFDALPPGEALATYLDQVQLVSDADTMKDGAVPQVTLITLHSAKGLEFPVVFITGVEEGLLPVSRAIQNEGNDPNAIEEERRLFYVGITRAERLLFLTYTAGRSRYGQFETTVPSRFLANLPVESVRSHGTRAASASSLAQRSRGWGSIPGGRASQVIPTQKPVEPDWASRAAPAAPPAPNYVIGMKVFHPKFGEGEIKEIAERRDDHELVIAFKRHDTKRLLASLAKLDVIE